MNRRDRVMFYPTQSPVGSPEAEILTSNSEQIRLDQDRRKQVPWRKWGPYLSERQWGTVREDYSPNGDAWNYFTHDQARSRAYRGGEDGLAGICDDRQLLCFRAGAVEWQRPPGPVLRRVRGICKGRPGRTDADQF